MKTNGGLNSVRGSCGDETSRVKEDEGKKKQVKKKASRLYIPKFFGNNLPIRSEMVRLAMIVSK